MKLLNKKSHLIMSGAYHVKLIPLVTKMNYIAENVVRKRYIHTNTHTHRTTTVALWCMCCVN